MHDGLLALICCEKEEDGLDLNKVVDDIIKIADNLGVKDIAISPFSHLSSNLIKIDIIQRIINEIYRILSFSDFNILYVPFCWNKAFEINSKGHGYNVI